MKFKVSDYLYVFSLVGIVCILPQLVDIVCILPQFKTTETLARQPSLEERYFDQSTSVVLISRDDGGLGSGFFIGTHLIATANHVVEGQDVVDIYLKGRKKPIKGKVTQYSDDSDLALVEVATEQPNAYLSLSPRKQQVGQKVYAIGHPKGLKWSMSSGIISHVNRGNMTGGLNGFIQIDAPINGGCSGGPVFDMNGDVIGIVSYGIRSSDGLAFIVPVKYLKSLL